MIVGIDIGGSTTDAVVLDGGVRVVSVEANDAFAAAAGALGKLAVGLPGSLQSIRAVAVTGVGASVLDKELLGIPVIPVAEITAVGVGGTTLAGVDEALVVSMGTGTALVRVAGGQATHVGGTGVGGGTLLGLSKHLLNVTRIESIERLAAAGDLARVDLTIGDIAGAPVGRLPMDATASNFGNLRADATAEDKARALVNMIAEVIVSLSVTAARVHGLGQIVLTGKLVRVRPLLDRIRSLSEMFGTTFLIPEHADFATAIGAARHAASSAGKA